MLAHVMAPPSLALTATVTDAPYMAHAIQLQELTFSSARDLDDEENDDAKLSPQDGKKSDQWILSGAETGCLSSGIWSFSATGAPMSMKGEPETRSYPFIESGYRPTSSTMSANLRSLFQLHNETVNVWTHVVGAGLFVHKLIQLLIREAPFPAQMQTMDTLVIGAYILAAINCMVLSAAFHLFSSSSDSLWRRLEAMDRFGILMLMLGSNLPMIFYGFYDKVEWQIAYIMCSVLGVATAYLVLNLERLKEVRGLKIGVFVAVALIGWCQLAHDLWARGGMESVSSQKALEAWVETFAWYVLGVVFYAFQIPERFWPGAFDIVGSSHQLWHVCVVLGALQHLEGCLSYARLAGAFPV